MQKKSIILLVLVLIIPVLIFLLISTQSPKTSPFEEDSLIQCNSLIYNSEDKINLLFFSSENEAVEYSSELFSFYPLNENKEEFNIYYIEPSVYEPECEIYQNIAILCYSKSIIKTASSCPNDYIFVLKSESSEIRSSSYMNVVSINKNHQKSVIAHEFGHSFANLAEEYTPATLPLKSKNCVSECNKFDSLNEGCYEGCSKTDYFRSINSGIMRTLSSKSYGAFNSFLISEKISKFKRITGNVVSENDFNSCLDKEYYLISGLYNIETETINISSKTLDIGCVGSSGSGPFEYSINNIDGSTLGSGEFNPEFIFTDAQDSNDEQISGGVFNSNHEFILKIPVLKQADKLSISKEDKLLAEVELKDIGARPC